ncbi:MutS domain V family protein [Aspergillus niger]|uniref:MutS domain V family protein n=1 Tax=Aspergillus niger TaxID=5061 RepID=A0A505HLX1_ASPNG|nr:MutS domain V family protein [Aspergillus niger]
MRSSILLVAFSALAAAQSSVAVPQGQPSAAVTSSPVIPTQGSLPAGASSVLIGSSGVPSSFANDSSSKSGSSSSSSTSSGAGVPLATAGPVGLSVVAGAALAAFL